MYILRYILKKKGFRSEEIDIFLSSWKSSTIKSYNVYILKYIEFCLAKDYDILERSTNRLIKFLNYLFKEGCSYSAINIARSALSCIFFDPPIGDHKLVCRFLKGIFNLRPSRPKYSKVWNVKTVLIYLEGLTPSRDLDLKTLTFKTLMLIMLTSGQRAQTIHAINISNMEVSRNEVKICIYNILKHNKINNMNNTISLQAYHQNRKICVVTYIREYLKRTKNLRKGDQLFISYKSFKPVSKETLSSWIKNVLKSSGIDTSIYKAHSTRAASTSAAFQSVDISTILKAASWSNARTFGTFYNKPIEKESFSKAVLEKRKH